jgi:hypothetical protein
MKRVRPSQSSPTPTALDQSAPLSPFIIRKLAGRKGLIVDSVMKGVDGRRIVRLFVIVPPCTQTICVCNRNIDSGSSLAVGAIVEECLAKWAREGRAEATLEKSSRGR